MGQVSSKLRRATDGYSHWCPGCEEMHSITVDRVGGTNWTFNGNLERPTFSPSVRITGFDWPTDEEEVLILRREQVPRRPVCCHYFITDGQIQFCGDCTHGLNGQTVPLPDLPAFLTDAASAS